MNQSMPTQSPVDLSAHSAKSAASNLTVQPEAWSEGDKDLPREARHFCQHWHFLFSKTNTFKVPDFPIPYHR